MSNEILSTSTTDFFSVFADVEGADLAAWRRAQTFGAETTPQINEYWERAEYPIHLVKRLGELNLIADGLDVPGLEKMSPLAAGLVMMEVARADASMGTVIAVQGGLALRSIHMWGSPEQKEKWLGPIARCEQLAAFGLTEPDHGSDSVALSTTARREGDEWVLNGQKRWIGNGSVGDVTVIWARMDDGEVGGFIVEQDTPGYRAETIQGKVSMRAIPQALITMTDMRVPEANRLPGATSFRATSSVLFTTRSGISWMALGSAIACYEAALEHAQTRIQFGKPLASYQLIQQRLVNMLDEVTSMAMYCRRLADLEAVGKLIPQQGSMAKLHNTRAARRIAAEARDMLGGTGILLEKHVMRHMADIEAMHTFEGTESMQSLILGKKITGVGAFR
ncbi:MULTISPECIES: acyl-CoA dehydrogenase family protein [unclassified Luteococcus]|uniref:acyl-CoA dehydrogenase family protein n=1 Tax=unclassified Luteococcus TaxID=2639923 RepID=UPI00313EDA4A